MLRWITTPEKLSIRLNGKLVVSYYKRDLGNEILKGLLREVQMLIEHFDDQKVCEATIIGLQYPSVGACTVCGRHANLLGGLCRDCLQV